MSRRSMYGVVLTSVEQLPAGRTRICWAPDGAANERGESGARNLPAGARVSLIRDGRGSVIHVETSTMHEENEEAS